MRVLSVAFSVLLAVVLANALNIQDASVFSGNGEDEDNPADEDSLVTLRCSLSLDSNKDWVFCSWTHELTDQYNTNDEKLEVICSTADNQGTGQKCGNQGGSTYLQTYAQRLSMDVGTNYCGLKIDRAHPYDTGEWKCHVTDAPNGSPQYGTVDLFVSNQSSIHISEPDLEQDDSQTIIYDVNDRGEIEATCTSTGGRPAPTFKWYVNDDRNEIKSELNPDQQDSEWMGVPILSESISWEPSIDEMCDDYDLNEEACEFDVGSRERERARFTFELICKVEQGNLYQSDNDKQEAGVVVEWNGSSTLYASLSLLLASLAAVAFQL